MAMVARIAEGFRKVSERLTDLTTRHRHLDARVAQLERRVAAMIQDPDAQRLAPGSPLLDLDERFWARITGVDSDDPTGQTYLARRLVATDLGTLADDDVLTDPIKVQRVPARHPAGETGSWHPDPGTVVEVIWDGADDSGDPIYHVGIAPEGGGGGFVIAAFDGQRWRPDGTPAGEGDYGQVYTGHLVDADGDPDVAQPVQWRFFETAEYYDLVQTDAKVLLADLPPYLDGQTTWKDAEIYGPAYMGVLTPWAVYR